MTRKRRRIGKTAKTNDRLLDKSLVYSQTTPPKSHSKASSNIVSHSLDSQDSVKIKTNRKIPVVKIQDLTSRSKAVNTVSKEAKPLPSLIIWNLEESKDNDPARRHAHDLQLVESVLPLLLRSSTLLFADDVKIWRTRKSAADHLDLQADLDGLVRWAREWGLEINARKSVLMHIGHGNSYRYTIEEYCIQAASPCLAKDTKSLGPAQRVGTKLVKVLSRLPYGERLKRLNLFPLSYRRTRGDLILVFRIFNYDLGVNMSYLFAPSSTNNLRGHNKKGYKPRSNKLKVGSRFSHRVVNDWNALPEQVVSGPSVNTFKENLDLQWKAMCQD
ncbi:unnamed protein product [Schistosoma margrebowiei]|uniref:Uncharacterized protein n=1 Tax=Schistosoma margrebowiei TaxID=48269 RepID=A0A183MJX0_9TREM|nr:unnamed protein product [Schistosoma margrebowiei]